MAAVLIYFPIASVSWIRCVDLPSARQPRGDRPTAVCEEALRGQPRNSVRNRPYGRRFTGLDGAAPSEGVDCRFGSSGYHAWPGDAISPGGRRRRKNRRNRACSTESVLPGVVSYL